MKRHLGWYCVFRVGGWVTSFGSWLVSKSMRRVIAQSVVFHAYECDGKMVPAEHCTCLKQSSWSFKFNNGVTCTVHTLAEAENIRSHLDSNEYEILEKEKL